LAKGSRYLGYVKEFSCPEHCGVVRLLQEQWLLLEDASWYEPEKLERRRNCISFFVGVIIKRGTVYIFKPALTAIITTQPVPDGTSPVG
jgi:hypothetical protein